jgi:hypothetical protein
MTNFEENKHRLELIKMARELLNEEYINRRAQDHNRWLAESDVMWRTKRVKLPYPPFASYPTDEEIVAKATVLYNFVSTKPAAATAFPPIDPIPSPAEIAATSKILLTPVAEPTQSPWEKYLTPEQETKADEPNKVADTADSQIPVAEVVADSSPKNVDETQPTQPSLLVQNLLPGWIRRSQSA